MSFDLRRKSSGDEIERICIAAEKAARDFILARVPIKKISDLNVRVETYDDKPLILKVAISLELMSQASSPQKITDGATDAAFEAAELTLREMGLWRGSEN